MPANLLSIIPELKKEFDGHLTSLATNKSNHKLLNPSENRPLEFRDLPKYPTVLLLQGPIGPFFKKLADFLEGNGTSVYKVNFNAGDDHFFPPDNDQVIQYQYRIEYWPQFVKKLIADKKIDAVFLFGDCRPIHDPIRSLCKNQSVDLFIFEEGYLRPNFFTLESFGVNNYSAITSLPIDAIVHDACMFKDAPIVNSQNIDGTESMVWYGIRYWMANLLPNKKYTFYDHHRSLDLIRGFHWVRNFYRYYYYKITEKSIRNKIQNKSLLGHKGQSYFLFPLQVFDDAQILQHSNYDSIEQAIEEVVISFAKHIEMTNRSDVLIIKHHPMDRGHINYSTLIKKLTSILPIRNQVIYIHDIHLPTLITKLAGCVTINSTLGFKAILDGIPTITLGRSIYNKSGLTYQGNLDSFWTCSQGSIDHERATAFKHYLIRHTQIHGSLYSSAYQLI